MIIHATLNFSLYLYDHVTTQNTVFLLQYITKLAWRSGRVMDCRATARDSIPGWKGVFTELLVRCKGQ